MIIGLLLYGAAFTMLAVAQFTKKNKFQKMILPFFVNISKLTLLLIFCDLFLVAIDKKFFSLFCSGQLENHY